MYVRYTGRISLKRFIRTTHCPFYTRHQIVVNGFFNLFPKWRSVMNCKRLLRYFTLGQTRLNQSKIYSFGRGRINN